MTQNRNSIKIGYGLLALMTLGVFTLPPASADSLDAIDALSFDDLFSILENFDISDLYSADAADPKTHEITMAAVPLSNGQLAYQMIEHLIDDQDVTVERYGVDPTPSIPGPVLIFDEGDQIMLTLENQLGDLNEPGVDDCVSVHVHGVHYGIESDGTREATNKQIQSCATPDNPYTFVWSAVEGTAGTWPYHDHTFGSFLGAEEEGLFGAIIVNEKKTGALIDGKIKNIKTDEIDKEYILYMKGTTFWGVEIDNDKNTGQQTPLWTNPTLVSELGSIDRFHVLGIGSEFHTFHMHAHRWIDDGTTNVVDTQTIGPLTREVFVVKAGEGVGTGDWMYHCHVFAHMQAGMSGFYRVTNDGGESIPGASPLGDLVSFEIVDEPGPWFKNRAPLDGLSESLAVTGIGSTIHFDMTDTSTVHTVTSLIYPVTPSGPDATNMPFDQSDAFRGGAQVTLEDPGLYVFTCKIHPYMFAAVIADDPNTVGLDLGENIRIVNGIETPTLSPLAISLLRTFFVSTTPDLWQDYETGTWEVNLPAVDLRLTGGAVAPLSAINVGPIPLALTTPQYDGIGEVWINTQFETSEGKTKYGSATAVDTATWEVTKKVFGTGDKTLNHPHNMWTNTDNSIIYQTEWFDNELSSIDRDAAMVIDEIAIGESPSHVMTRPVDGDTAYVAMNGENSDFSIDVVILNPDGTLTEQLPLDIGAPHPHGHWMNNDHMVTPNAFTGSSSIYNFNTDTTTVVPHEDLQLFGSAFGVPIATKMHPSGDKYYLANLLDQTVVCVSIAPENPACNIDVSLDTEDGVADGKVAIKQILLIANLLDAGAPGDEIRGLLEEGEIMVTQSGPAGLLPIQTPVSPDGKYVVTATLLPSIVIIDADLDELVLSMACDAGCHGANFGANVNGGYNAYVSSKFSNALIVFDPVEAINADANADGILDATESTGVVGRVLLSSDNFSTDASSDDSVTGLDGMGGQGVLAIPNIYDEWIQETALLCGNGNIDGPFTECSSDINNWLGSLTPVQRNP